MSLHQWPYIDELAPQQFFPRIFPMNDHLSESSPTLIPSQTAFDILVNDIYNFGSSPPQTQESRDTSSLSEAESVG